MPACAFLHLVDGRGVADDRVGDFVGWLGVGEMSRYQRFVRPERRRQFLLGRVLARKALGELLGVYAQDLCIEDRSGQAPVLIGPHSSTSFSISHSGPWVACAVSADSALGLDIEQIDSKRNILSLAEQAFGEERRAWLAARPSKTRMRDFYAMWSAQEARIKLGAEPAMTTELQHPEISVVLCSSVALSPLPRLIVGSL